MSSYYPLYVGAAYPASGGGGSGDMVLASVQTVTGAKTFNDSTLLLANVAGTFSAKFTNTNTAARTYTLKDASGTVAFTSDITGTNSGTNTGDQTITLTGAVTGSGTGSFVASLGSFTKSQLDTAVSDGNVMYVGDPPTAHNQDASTITTGTLGVARGGTGLTALGTSLQVLRTNAGATALEYATITAGDALTANPLSQFAATTSAQLRGVISDETGSDALVFATSPTLVTPNIGAATGTSLAVTGANASTFLTLAKTGDATNYKLEVKRKQFVATVDYVAFDNTNNGTLYSDVLTFMRGSVGIGTNYPDSADDKLQVVGSIRGTTAVYVSASAKQGMEYDGSNTVQTGSIMFVMSGIADKRSWVFRDNANNSNKLRIYSGNSASSSGTDTPFHYTPTIAQSGTAGYTAFLQNATEISTGSGAKLLMDLQVGAASKFKIDNAGNLTASGNVTIGGGTAIAKVLSTTATLDFPSIASNDTHSLTMTVTGAIAGNAVFIGVPAALDANLIWQASVTAADTVTIRMHNASGASIDPASGTYRATVFQF